MPMVDGKKYSYTKKGKQAAVFSYPYDFQVWADLLYAPTHLLRSEGAAIERT